MNFTSIEVKSILKQHFQNINSFFIECSSEVLPPDGCTQYYTGTSGVIKSFNADAPAPITILADSYKICMRQEDGKY